MEEVQERVRMSKWEQAETLLCTNTNILHKRGVMLQGQFRGEYVKESVQLSLRPTIILPPQIIMRFSLKQNLFKIYSKSQNINIFELINCKISLCLFIADFHTCIFTSLLDKCPQMMFLMWYQNQNSAKSTTQNKKNIFPLFEVCQNK